MAVGCARSTGQDVTGRLQGLARTRGGNGGGHEGGRETLGLERDQGMRDQGEGTRG